MSDREQLLAIKQQALQRIAELTADPKPSYRIDGQSVAWNDYLRQLQTTVDWCNAKLAADEPFEGQTQAFT